MMLGRMSSRIGFEATGGCYGDGAGWRRWAPMGVLSGCWHLLDIRSPWAGEETWVGSCFTQAAILPWKHWGSRDPQIWPKVPAPRANPFKWRENHVTKGIISQGPSLEHPWIHKSNSTHIESSATKHLVLCLTRSRCSISGCFYYNKDNFLMQKLNWKLKFLLGWELESSSGPGLWEPDEICS